MLIVDDEPSAREGLARLFALEGYQTVVAADGALALALAKQRLPDIVVSDLKMPVMGGHELCLRLHEIDSDLPVIVVTAMDQREAGLECLRVGAENFASKPIQFDTLVWSVQRALLRRASKREAERSRKACELLQNEIRNVNERLVLTSLREQALAESEALQRAQLNLLLERLSEGVVISDGSGRVQMVNQAARAILGLGTDELSLANLDLMEGRDAGGSPLPLAESPVRRALRGEEFSAFERSVVRGDGDRRTILSTGGCARDAEGDIVLAIVVFRDVTELRRLEQRREEYTALISHDLRNPLSVLLLSVQMLAEDMGVRRQVGELAHVARIERNASRMKQMLEELTEATRLESKAVAMERVPCDLSDLVNTVLGRLDQTSARRVTIEADKGPHVVMGDAAQLERCITNLLTNGLKYSAEGAVVTVRLARAENAVHLRVSDCGIGVAPESVKDLFQRYSRTNAGKAHAEGLGLGLYITRLIVEAHGGRIDVQSQVDEGSTFSVSLPPASTGPNLVS